MRSVSQLKCRKRAFQSQLSAQSGFLLLEVLIALLVLAVFTVIVAQYQALIIDWSSQAHQRMRAVNCASSSLMPKVSEQSLGMDDLLCTRHSRPCTLHGISGQVVRVVTSWSNQAGHTGEVELATFMVES